MTTVKLFNLLCPRPEASERTITTFSLQKITSHLYVSFHLQQKPLMFPITAHLWGTYIIIIIIIIISFMQGICIYVYIPETNNVP
jgi:hypothetical protein